MAQPTMDKVLLDSERLFTNLELGLDSRLVKAVAKLGLIHPTLVQMQAIPLALAGKDLLVRARTGSGKTIAYALPLLQKILADKASATSDQSAPRIRALVLVPTRELVEQARNNVFELTYYCRDVVRVIGLGSEKADTQLTWLNQRPDVVVSTPGRLVHMLDRAAKTKTTSSKKSKTDTTGFLTQVDTLVVDEADLVFSYGYSDDIARLVKELPSVCQSFLMSATLDDDIEQLKSLVLHNPAVVKLEEAHGAGADGEGGDLAQWFLPVGKDDKDLIVFALLRLRLISGKTVFFVNSTDRCYRLKLLLEQFSIKSAVLNAELPENSRLHILKEFNKGLFDFLIATDESMEKQEQDYVSDDDDDDDDDDVSEADEADDVTMEEDDEEEEEELEAEADIAAALTKKLKGKKTTESSSDDDEESEDEAKAASTEEEEVKQEEESEKEAAKKEARLAKNRRRRARKSSGNTLDNADFGVARGVDFRGVTTVINVDLPTSVDAYIHRIGRTARGGASGVALSVVNVDDPAEKEMLTQIQDAQEMINNPDVAVGGEVAQPCPLAFNMSEIEGFRYRVMDVRRAVTRAAVQDARVKEIKYEMLNSQRLKSHFEDNPKDLSLLKHDVALRPSKVQGHLAHIPSYLMPKNVQSSDLDMNTQQRRKRKRKAAENAKQAELDIEAAKAKGGASLMRLSVVGKSSSGRQAWKERHRKGKFNPRGIKRVNKKRQDPLF